VPVYAVIDVGTNSVKFHIGERLEDGSWRKIVDRAEVTRLGEGLREGGEFAPAAIERTVEAIAGMAEEAKTHGASGTVGVGTMGLRIARNADTFIAEVRERCGLDLEVVSGEEEARLAYIATVSGLGLAVGSLVIFDTGGGSTQFTIGRGIQVEDRFSLNLGAVRLTEQFGLDGPVTPEDLSYTQDAISGELGRLDDLPRPDTLVGMGGALTNMTAVMHGLAVYDPELVHGSVLSRQEVDRQIELYRSRETEARRQIVGLQPGRAEVILAGACVVRAVMEKLGREALSVSDRGLRHGLLIDRCGLADSADQASPSARVDPPDQAGSSG
jgi:exopolyphosphatase/guanosine-5'-triphosphate,3'-diphosphate pyrophosphatase